MLRQDWERKKSADVRNNHHLHGFTSPLRKNAHALKFERLSRHLLGGIASGLLVARSFNERLLAAVLGLACHFYIAVSAAAAFYVASRKITFLTGRAVVSGVIYGVLVYFVMYKIVVSLSHLSRRPSSLPRRSVCVGLPIASMVRAYSR
jgi:hypothetical protein